jgi:hypothetical protein
MISLAERIRAITPTMAMVDSSTYQPLLVATARRISRIFILDPTLRDYELTDYDIPDPLEWAGSPRIAVISRRNCWYPIFSRTLARLAINAVS